MLDRHGLPLCSMDSSMLMVPRFASCVAGLVEPLVRARQTKIWFQKQLDVSKGTSRQFSGAILLVCCLYD